MSYRDIKLQDRAIQFLKIASESGRLSHSLLFFGPESVGKSLAALTLAKATNCPVNGPVDSCDTCASCRKIEGRNHADVMVIGPEGAGNAIRIESIKKIRERINLKPFEGKVKFFIIDKAHLLTEEAANSLLKTLEEPPENSVIILLTDDLHRLFPTIRSRCQWVLFSSARPDDLSELLVKDYGVNKEYSHFLSRFSGGGIGKAISMRDNEAMSWKNSVINNFSRKSVILDEDPLFLGSRRDNALDILDVLTSWYRDIFILKSGGDASLLANIDRMEDLAKKKNSLSQDEISGILEEVLKMRLYISQNVNPKLALSSLAAKVR